MGCLEVKISEAGRGRLGITLVFLNLITSLVGFAVIGSGLFLISNKTISSLAIVHDIKTGPLPIYLIMLGVFTVFFHLVHGKMSYHFRTYKTRRAYRRYYVICVYVSFILFWAAVAAAASTRTHRNELGRTLNIGFKTMMRRYVEGGNIKQKIDELQTDMQCCGSEKYSDWFDIGWMSTNYVDVTVAGYKG